MSTSEDVQRILNLYKAQQRGWVNAKYDKDGYITHAYFYPENEKNDATHIHVSWSYDNKQYDYVLKCNWGHSNPTYMDGNGSDNDYVQEFVRLLEFCYNNPNYYEGGSRKKTSKRAGRSKRRRYTRRH